MLVQDIVVAYVDSPTSMLWALRRAITTLGRHLFPGDLGVKWDPSHCINLLKDSCPANHPCWARAQEHLLSILFIDHPDDAAAYKGDRQKIRRIIPPPSHLVPALETWLNHWTEHGLDQSTGQHLFSCASLKLIMRIIRAAKLWMLSGE
jgi:hypothetical protein